MDEHRVADVSHVDNADVVHEESDVNVRAILATAVGLVIVAIVVQLLMYVLFGYFGGREARKVPRQYPLATGETALPPPPRLQANPVQDLKDLRRGEDRILDTYGWVDEPGVARIPIGRAMQLTLERGLPARPEPPPAHAMPERSSSGRMMEDRKP